MSQSVDPITVQILRNRVGSLMDEMHHHFFRSGYSAIVRESRDFSCVILDARGRILVAPPMFFHSTSYKYLVRRIFELYGDDGLTEGDIYLCNHPYDGNLPHVPDMAVIVPIFHEATLVGFAGSIAHKADIGGTVPGSTLARRPSCSRKASSSRPYGTTGPACITWMWREPSAPTAGYRS